MKIMLEKRDAVIQAIVNEFHLILNDEYDGIVRAMEEAYESAPPLKRFAYPFSINVSIRPTPMEIELSVGLSYKVSYKAQSDGLSIDLSSQLDMFDREPAEQAEELLPNIVRESEEDSAPELIPPDEEDSSIVDGGGVGRDDFELEPEPEVHPESDEMEDEFPY